MKILFIFLLSVLPQVLSQHWVDPHDMNTEDTKQYLKKSETTGDVPHRKEECGVNVRENNSLVYLKRVINLLLSSANIDKSGSMERSGYLHFTINDEDFIFLKSFSSMENVNMDDLRKMDTILSKSLKRSYLDNISDILLSTQERFSQLVITQNSLPLLALTLFLYIAYNLFKSNFSVWYVFRYFILMVILVDFIQRYQQLFEEAEEHNMNLKYSLKCDTSKMSWGEYFKFLTSNEDCEKKVVSILEVGLNQVKSVIIIPLAAAGTGMGQFASGLWKNLPFPWNILIFPIMLIFCAILTAIVMTTLNNTPFKFNLMHLFHLEFGEKKANITGTTLEKLLDAVNHRPMFQVVQSAADKTPPKNANRSNKTVKEKRDPRPHQKKNTKNIKNDYQTQTVVVTTASGGDEQVQCEGNSS